MREVVGPQKDRQSINVERIMLPCYQTSNGRLHAVAATPNHKFRHAKRRREAPVKGISLPVIDEAFLW